MSLSEVSLCVCVHMTGGEGLDEGQRSHTYTKTARASDPDRDERQHAGAQTVTVPIVLHCFKWIVFCNRQYIKLKGLYFFLAFALKMFFGSLDFNAASTV